MTTLQTDKIRMDIFREIMNCNQDTLLKVYDFMKNISQTKEYAMTKDILQAAAMTAKESHLKGKSCSTKTAMNKVDAIMQWK